MPPVWITRSRTQTTTMLRQIAKDIYEATHKNEYRVSRYKDGTTGEIIIRILPVK